LEKAFEMFAADRGVIFLVNQETGEIVQVRYNMFYS
jgi:hypothetical protein